MNWHYARINVASDGITLVVPHPSAPTSTVGNIVAKVTYATCDGQPTEDSKELAKILALAFNEWVARNPEYLKTLQQKTQPGEPLYGGPATPKFRRIYNKELKRTKKFGTP